MKDFTVSSADCDLVTSFEDWRTAQGFPAITEKNEDSIDSEEWDLVNKILALEFSHWFLRRCAGTGADGSAVESIWTLRGEAVQKYNDTINKPYFNVNKDKTW